MFGTACATAEPTVTPEPTPAPTTATPIPVASINTLSESSRAETVDEMMDEPISPFTNIAPLVLVDPDTGEDLWMIENRHPGVAIFDYDRDGDMDLYVTSAESEALLPDTTGGPNRLFRNDGDHVYTEVAEEAGVDLPIANSTGVAACDIDNDGYQDLYVASYGRIGDNLDYRAGSLLFWALRHHQGSIVQEQWRWHLRGNNRLGVGGCGKSPFGFQRRMRRRKQRRLDRHLHQQPS